MEKCVICGKEYKRIACHLTKIHKISFREYYFDYLKNPMVYCKVCGKPVMFVRNNIKDYCSNGCERVIRTQKIKEIVLRKYGTSCTLNTQENIGKKKNTWKSKYGVDNPSKSSEVKEKKKQTFLDKYGVNSVFNIKENREKAILKAKSKESLLKRKQTFNDIYGKDHPLQNKDILGKQQTTNLERYGHICSLHNTEIEKKVKETWNKKYGVDNPSKNKDIIDRLSKIAFYRENIKRKKFLPIVKKTLKNNGLTLLSEYNHSHKTITVICDVCGNTYESSYNTMHKCSICYPKATSIAEKDLSSFVKSLGFKIESNNRKMIKPSELDIYLPDKKIAIEYHGLYWHSEEKGKNKNYHLNKLSKCLNRNIKLLQIFEDEWLFKKDIVKNRIKQILKINKLSIDNDQRIHARKCKIEEIDSKIKNKFLEKYHIQGEDTSKIKLGAFCRDDLVAVMTFSKGNIAKGNRSKKGIWELNRFCTDYKYRIPGVASKLLTYFKRNYEWKEIFSYADRRWSVGNLYYKLGFELERCTEPNYWYVRNGFRFHRFGLRKRAEEPKDVPEWLLRLNEGYSRIWDCGHLKFVTKKS